MSWLSVSFEVPGEQVEALSEREVGDEDP